MFFSEKSFKIRKTKKYLEKIKETLGELRDYTTMIQIASQIAKELKKDKKDIEVFFSSNSPKDKMLFDYFNDINKDLLKELKKVPETVKGEDWKTFKEYVSAEIERSPKNEFENIAFAGGGAKGMAYPGSIRAFAENEIHFKRVSGTSAGAITALPFALGYSPRKIESIVYNYDFTNFIYESNFHKNPLLNKLFSTFDSKTEALMHRTVYLDTFKKEFEKPFFKYLIYSGKLKEIGINIDRGNVRASGLKSTMAHIEELLETNKVNLEARKRLYKEMDVPLKKIVQMAQKKARKAFVKSVKEEKPHIKEKVLDEMIGQGFKNEKDAIREFFRMYRHEDVIEEFFGDLIENKLSTLGKKKLEAVERGLSKPENLRKINFKQFRKLVEAYPESHLKDLTVCVCQKLSDNPLKILDKDNYKQIDVSADNKEKMIREIPLKVAVRMSMNLPGAYSSYVYKGRKYVDGGVRANFPLHHFDKALKIPRAKTMGLCLAPEDTLRRTSNINHMGTPEESAVIDETKPLKAFFIKLKNTFSRAVAYMRADKLDNNKPFDPLDLTRVGVINVMDVGTIDFAIHKEEKLKLFKQGYETACDMMQPHYNAQLRYYKERVRTLYEYVEKTIKELPKEDIEKHILTKGRNEEYEIIKSKMKQWNVLESEREYNIKSRISRAFK